MVENARWSDFQRNESLMRSSLNNNENALINYRLCFAVYKTVAQTSVVFRVEPMGPWTLKKSLQMIPVERQDWEPPGGMMSPNR